MNDDEPPQSPPDLHRVRKENASQLTVDVPVKWMVDLEERAYDLTEPGIQTVGTDDLARIAIREYLYGDQGDDVDEGRIREIVRGELAAWDAAGTEPRDTEHR